MKSDRELLELAAKAAGYRICHLVDEGRAAYVSDDLVGERFYWRPYVDDGDALRLAVRLRMIVSLADCCCCAVVDWSGNEDDNEIHVRFSKDFSDCEAEDAQQATRIAIVRAAAEIGIAASGTAPSDPESP